MMRYRWKKEDELFLVNNYPHKGAEYCAGKLHLRENQVRRKINHLGLKVTKARKSQVQSQTATRYKPTMCGVNANDFINCNTPEIAYVLGFIWADGYLHIKKRKICIEIVRPDWQELLDTFNKTGSWTTFHRERKDRQPISGFTTCNKQLFEFFLKYDYDKKSYKSADKILDFLPERLRPYWFRGYFDGDGGFYVKPRECYQMSFCSSYEQDWSFITSLLDKLNVKCRVIRRIQGEYKHSVVRSSSKKDLSLFGRYIYNDYDGMGMGLSRKYNKWQQITCDDLWEQALMDRPLENPRFLKQHLCQSF